MGAPRLGLALLSSAIAATAASSGAAPIETETLYLSGRYGGPPALWDFRCSAGRNCGEWTRIRVPSCWEQEGFGAYQYGRAPRAAGPDGSAVGDEEARYRTRFVVPRAWKGRRLRLVFEGAMTDTEAWLNGRSVGPVHQGGFYRFDYDVTALARPGADNVLEVTVRKSSSNESVNRAERRGDYWNFGGIYRPVYLEAMPPSFLERMAIDARADGSFLADVFVGGAAGSARVVRAQVEDLGGRAVGPPLEAAVDAASGRATLRGRAPGVRAWTAETPHLYRVQATLLVDGAPRHRLRERFGFRTFEVRAGDGLYLNGRRIVLKGTNRHSFSADTGRTLGPEASLEDVRLLKEMNMNAVRMSHYPPDVHFLDACDELGLYVLDELAGWQGSYDEPTGRRLAAQTVRRDVNHPSILFWDNGNEGGWNTAVDDEFARWDPQRRPVLHPWAAFGGIETAHYRTYGETLRLLKGPDLYLPTEFLHGLYDGGNGAGLWDHWEAMRASPLAAGGFLWAFVDECVARTDQGGRLDCAGSNAPDGIVGPRREKEGSFHAVREIWSPVAVLDERVEGGRLRVENRFDFTDLSRCRFEWTLVRFAGPGEAGPARREVARGTVAGPAVPPGAAGTLDLPLPGAWREADALYVSAHGPDGRELWTWSWRIRPAPASPAVADDAPVRVEEGPAGVAVATGALELRFAKDTAALTVRRGAVAMALGAPHFVAYLRSERAAEPVPEPGRTRFGGGRMGTTRYADVSGGPAFEALAVTRRGAEAVVEATYGGGRGSIRWRISPGERVRLEYSFAFEGEVDLLGVSHGPSSSHPLRMRWLGRGPYRVWKNRMKGTRLDVWDNAWNEARPGSDWSFPEFQGYFDGWSWAELEFVEGTLVLARAHEGGDGPRFLGVYTPRDGAPGPLAELPETEIAFLHGIPAVRNKFEAADLLGPESQPARITGPVAGAVELRFRPGATEREPRAGSRPSPGR